MPHLINIPEVFFGKHCTLQLNIMLNYECEPIIFYIIFYKHTLRQCWLLKINIGVVSNHASQV